MSIAIRAENISKAYQLGEIGTGTLSRDLERWISRVRGKEDPFIRIGETNDRTTKGTSDIVWSLIDINFEIEQGDAVGIIGRNGAGKSTLLKVLSRVTSPTSGRIKGKGRIASLLEVGTGFHPELTGRENIYLNGAILGMRKREITRKFDEIVEFAGVERYIDTPVKRYSSGMYVRLAFAVAAYLESEILIIDEVLAVGDSEFQKKCLGKMSEVSRGEGKTVLFVSHNMAAVNNLCTSAILLEKGKCVKQGPVKDIISNYNLTRQANRNLKDEKNRNYILINYIKFKVNNVEIDEVMVGENLLIEFKIEKIFNKILNNIKIGIALEETSSSTFVMINYSHFSNVIFDDVNGIYKIYFDRINIVSGSYIMHLRILSDQLEIFWNSAVADLTIRKGDYFGTGENGEETLCYNLHNLIWTKQ